MGLWYGATFCSVGSGGTMLQPTLRSMIDVEARQMMHE